MLEVGEDSVRIGTLAGRQHTNGFIRKLEPARPESMAASEFQSVGRASKEQESRGPMPSMPRFRQHLRRRAILRRLA